MATRKPFPLSFASVPLAVLLLSCLCEPIFFSRLGAAPIYKTMEASEAMIVKDFVSSRDWILPLCSLRCDGGFIMLRPPLFHWIAAFVSLAVGRVSEWTARLPSAVFASLGIIVTFVLGRYLFDPFTGFLAGLLLITSPGYVQMGREIWVDATLTFFLLAAFACFYLSYQAGTWRGVLPYLFYLAVAAAVLAKGPVGYVLPAVTILVFLALRRELALSYEILSHRGMVLALLIPLIWHTLALWHRGWPFFYEQIILSNFQRFLVGVGPGLAKKRASSYFFVFVFLEMAFPWSLLFLFGLGKFFTSGAIREKEAYPFVVLAVIFCFFSLSAMKRDVYILPLYPAAALFTARWGWMSLRFDGHPLGSGVKKSLLAILVGAYLLVSALGLVWVVGTLTGKLSPDVQWLVGSRRQWIYVVTLMISHRPFYFLLIDCLLTACGLAVAWEMAKGRWQKGMGFLLVLLLIFYGSLYPLGQQEYKEFMSYKRFGVELARKVERGETLYFYGTEGLTQIYFYVNRVISPAQCSREKDFGSCLPGYYLLLADFWQRARSELAGKAEEILRSKGLAGRGVEKDVVLVKLL